MIFDFYLEAWLYQMKHKIDGAIVRCSGMPTQCWIIK